MPAEQAQQAKALMNKLSTVDLSDLTIKQAEELAGRKLTLKEKIGFKIAKKKRSQPLTYGTANHEHNVPNQNNRIHQAQTIAQDDHAGLHQSP
jgi:hypothetical protein